MTAVQRALALAVLVAAGGALPGTAHAVSDRDFYLDSTTPPPGNGAITYFRFGEGGFGFEDWERGLGDNPPQGVANALLVVDYRSSWGGGGIALTGGALSGGQRTEDLSEFEGGSLRFWLKSHRALQVEIQFGSSFQPIASTAVDVPDTGLAWQEITIPLSQFGTVDFSTIRVPFLIKIPHKYEGPPHTDFLIDHVRWMAPPAQAPLFRPGSTRVNPGGRRLFLVSNAVNPALTTSPANLGTLSVPTGNAVVFTANPTLQAGTLNGDKDGFIGTASIEITNANLDQELGLISESISGPLGTTAGLFPYAGTAASTITLTDVSTDFREGAISVRSDLTVAADDFAGWAIEMLSGSANMNEYFDGSIRFWFRANAALAGRVGVTVRSENVAAGSEQKIWLHNLGVAFNDTWQPVVIPIDQLAGPAPQTDLSRVKVLFNVSVASPVAGGRFFIDHLRWDSRRPGPLDHIEVIPPVVSIPKTLKQTFIARGVDANGIPVDIWPTWNAGSLGSLSRTEGESTRLSASASPVSGNLTATANGMTGISAVTVTNVEFTQSFNVYSDAGAGAQIGLDPNDGSIGLSEQAPGDAPEGSKVMRATYGLSGAGDYVTWFVYEPVGTRFLEAFNQGYLHFWIRSTRDLEISIRSDNVNPQFNRAKVRLSSLGLPLDGSWQEVWLSLNDFKLMEPTLDFSQMKVFFGVAAIQGQLGDVAGQVFDVDDVKWFTSSPDAPDPNKILAGLEAKQDPSGLVVSFDNDGLSRAVTYDQALAAMAYIYHQQTSRAKNVLDVYKAKFGAGAGFAGFHEEYQASNPNVIRDYDRTVGPNAFLALAMLHYKAVTGSATYDDVILGVANWIRDRQDPGDLGIRYGFLGLGGAPANNKSTEHNMDAYAVFRNVASLLGDTSFNTDANEVMAYLTNEMWTGTRFRVGENAAGTVIEDRALDCYSWAPLALSSFTSVVGLAEADFGVTKVNDTTGVSVEGFDFSGLPGNAVDKDAVWLEGTGQMALAYLFVEDATRAAKYINELEKAVYVSGTGRQSMTYATNAGTAYGFTMDSTHGAISSMAWYLFAKRNFNPFQPIPFFSFEIRRISDNAPAGGDITWATSVPARWSRAQHYVKLRVQGISLAPWGVQIYTDNRNPGNALRYVDPTPSDPINGDSDPTGLLRNLGQATTSEKIPLSWRIQGSTSPVPNTTPPFTLLDGGDGEAFNWFFIKDRASPATDGDGDGAVGGPFDGTPFVNGDDYVTIMNNAGIHASQGPAGYVPDLATQFLYFQADFTTAAAQVPYVAPIYIEVFFE